MDNDELRRRWAETYRVEFPRVYRGLCAVVRNADIARDALHDAFLQGLSTPPAHAENIAGWLFRVALRRSRRGPYRSAVGAFVETVIPGRHDEIAQALDRMEVAGLLGMLSERQRAMVVAQYYIGLDQDEIARLFGVRRGTVAATLAQAKARMRVGGQRA